MKNSIWQLIAASPHHADNPGGQTAYAAQLNQWNVKWGEVHKLAMKLGTAAITSSECFSYGTHGHNRRNCGLPVNYAERLL